MSVFWTKRLFEKDFEFQLERNSLVRIVVDDDDVFFLDWRLAGLPANVEPITIRCGQFYEQKSTTGQMKFLKCTDFGQNGR